LGVVDGVQQGSIEMAQTAPYYFFGKDETFALGCAIPFGLNSRQTTAWMYEGNGLKLMRDFYKQFNIINFPMGNTGAQMGGWWRKEIKSPEDMKGVKMRIGGFAGQVMAKLGVEPQQIAGGEIYPALEKGTIDAAEWVGPYDDEKLGFVKIAKYYYYPGWWEGGAQPHLLINLGKWNELPKVYQALIQTCARESGAWMTTKYDVQNPQAVKRLVASGAELRAFPQPVMEACYNAANEIYADIAKTNAPFKKMLDSLTAYRSDSYQWLQVAELAFDTFHDADAHAGVRGVSFRGPSEAREPGIHTLRPWLWIPGSRLRCAPE
jgi:TRAP-type mannitol/chloroaromatic compound transport system substrate-binding protein